MSQISTSGLLSFISGNPVEPYGDANVANRVRPILESCMSDAVSYVHRNVSRAGRGIFVARAFSLFFALVPTRLGDVSPTFQEAWDSHYKKQLATNLDRLGQLGLVANLQLPSPDDSVDIAKSPLNQTGLALFQLYLDFLTNLNAREAISRDPSFLGELRVVENINTIPEKEWQHAWNVEFRGSVLRRLEENCTLMLMQSRLKKKTECLVSSLQFNPQEQGKTVWQRSKCILSLYF
jgi:hypothetical protein